MSIPESWEEKARGNRGMVTAITMTICMLVLVLMGVFGLNQLKQPFGGQASNGSTCAPEDVVTKDKVTREEVQVSVYNAGGDKGVAGRTLERLERGGFRAGEVGNAPGGRTIETAVVYTTRKQDMRAVLVSRFMGGIPVRVVDEDFGPGVDVFIGPKPKRFNAKAPRELKLPEPITRCDD